MVCLQEIAGIPPFKQMQEDALKGFKAILQGLLGANQVHFMHIRYIVPMKLDLITSREEHFIRIQAKGKWDRDNAIEFIDYVLGKVQTLKCDKVLADCKDVLAPSEQMTRFYAGEYMAEKWSHHFKTALILELEVYNGLLENVALNRGAWIKAFFEIENGIDWLLA